MPAFVLADQPAEDLVTWYQRRRQGGRWQGLRQCRRGPVAAGSCRHVVRLRLRCRRYPQPFRYR